MKLMNLKLFQPRILLHLLNYVGFTNVEEMIILPVNAWIIKGKIYSSRDLAPAKVPTPTIASANALIMMNKILKEKKINHRSCQSGSFK